MTCHMSQCSSAFVLFDAVKDQYDAFCLTVHVLHTAAALGSSIGKVFVWQQICL